MGDEAGERTYYHVRKEQYATDIGPYFDVWMVYLSRPGEDYERVCMCWTAQWADDIMRALNAELRERSGGDGE